MNRFDPATMVPNPHAPALGGSALSRGIRPGVSGVRFPGSRQQSAMMPGAAGLRRRRS